MNPQEINLYNKDKYKVLVGKKTSTALCTCWNDPFTLNKKYSDIRKLFAICGSLYSREGVSIIIRNLALNPHIHTVFVWGNGRLSNTAIGSKGKNILFDLWNNSQGCSSDALNTIHKEIDVKVLESMMKKLTFIDLSELSFDEVLDRAKEVSQIKKEYMKPISFPEPVRRDEEPLPSEKMNFSVRARDLTQAWIRALDRVVRYGRLKDTQAGSMQKEIISLTWTIESTDTSGLDKIEWPHHLKERVGIEKSILDQYATIFLDPQKSSDVSYTYGNRLRNYKGEQDQIQNMIDMINETKITRRAFATTFDPIVDHDNTSPPCLISIQVLVSDDNKLQMIAYFRSHDIFKAALPNAYGLLHVLEHISRETKIPSGGLTIHSTSAHIYEDDFDDAGNLLKCAMWERVKLYFDENEDIDPRGIVRIELDKKEILCSLLDDAGNVLHEYRGKSAREVSLHFARLALLSRNEHTVDITIELTKAELAMKLEKEYVQDKALIIDTIIIK